MKLIHAVSLGASDEVLDHSDTDLACRLEGWGIGETRPTLRELAATEPEEALGLATGQIGDNFTARILQQLTQLLAALEHVS